jgi:hypothetical protein
VHAAEALCISNDDCKPLIRALTIALFSFPAVPALVARTPRKTLAPTRADLIRFAW